MMASLLPLLTFLLPASALILREVTLPPFIIAGDRASLGCDYDTQGEQIYSVKWYKGGLEIFRYQPSLKDRPISVYRRPGVHIVEGESNSTQIVLVNTSLETTGRFRCEVSTEAPMFSSESKYGDLLVVALPAHPPVILGAESHYDPGDFLHLNCSSYESRPAADLTWYINDQQADGGYVIPHPITMNNRTGLYTSRSELFMTLGRIHFNQAGHLSVRCEATIGSNNNTESIYSK